MLMKRLFRSARQRVTAALVLGGLAAGGVVLSVFAQTTADPFPAAIPQTADAVTVGAADFAMIPGVAGAPRMMLLTAEPGGTRLFVNDMRGPLYSVSATTARR